MLQIQFMGTILKRLRDAGWIQNPGYAIRLNPRGLERGKERTMVVHPIEIDPTIDTGKQIDKFFKSLINSITRYGAKSVYLPGGGTIPIPQFFKDFCNEMGIEIIIVDSENINDILMNI